MRSDTEKWHRRTLRYYIQALPADHYDVRLVAPGKPTQRRLCRDDGSNADDVIQLTD